MRRANMISNELLQQIDIGNTLNGGISQPKVKLSQCLTYRQIELHVPGISENQLHVSINNNQLVIYYELKLLSGTSLVVIPSIVYNKQIPYFVDATRIAANFESGVLTVQMPYNELANGYHRDIPINS